MNIVSVKPEVILLSCWILFVFCCTEAEGVTWKLYHASDEGFYFYDVESITKSKDVVRVSEKSVVRQIKTHNLVKALKEIVEIQKKSPGEMSDELREKTIDTLALQTTRRLYEMRCSKKMYRIITGMKYDKEGTLIDGVISSKWDAVNPDYIIEKLYTAVCH